MTKVACTRKGNKTNRADRKMTVLPLGLNSESMRIPLEAPMNSLSLPVFLPLAQPPWNAAICLAHNSAALCPGQTKIGTGSVRKWSKSRHKAMEGTHWAFIVSRLSQIMFHVQTKQVQNGKGLGTPRRDNPQCRADREGFRLLTTSTDPLLLGRNTFQHRN